MSTASLITRSLIGDPRIFHGFWHSSGATLPPGTILTVSIPVYAFIASGTTLFIAWVAARSWLIANALIFKSIYPQTRTSLVESQYAALLVNSRAPVHSLLTASQLARHGGSRKTPIKIVLAALFLLSLKAAIPVFVSVFPIRHAGLISTSTDCGYGFNLTASEAELWNWIFHQKRFSDAALTSVDQNLSEDGEALTLAYLRKPTQSYILQCPAGATCHPDHPFTFASTYTLGPQHFGFNIDIQFSLQVSDTCYRPIDALAPFSDADSVLYGLYYGPQQIRGLTINETDFVSGDVDNAPGYTLRYRWALADDFTNTSPWLPNSTLVLGGDTSILFYHIGWTLRTEPGDDPIFATADISRSQLSPLITFYNPRYRVVPIVCDTKYHVCSEGDCSPIGPMSHIVTWMNKSGGVWDDISTFFTGSVAIPPIAAAAWSSGAIASAQTIQDRWVQGVPENNTVARELGRLSEGGMVRLASSLQLGAAGFWNVGYGAPVGRPQYGLCSNVVIASTTAVSILLTPYWFILPISIVIIIISYADLLGFTKLRSWKTYKDAWTLYSVGQLHRQVAEQQLGRLDSAEPSKKWPDLSSGQVAGLDVGDRNGSKYLTPVTNTLTSPEDTHTHLLFHYPP